MAVVLSSGSSSHRSRSLLRWHSGNYSCPFSIVRFILDSVSSDTVVSACCCTANGGHQRTPSEEPFEGVALKQSSSRTRPTLPISEADDRNFNPNPTNNMILLTLAYKVYVNLCKAHTSLTYLSRAITVPITSSHGAGIPVQELELAARGERPPLLSLDRSERYIIGRVTLRYRFSHGISAFMSVPWPCGQLNCVRRHGPGMLYNEERAGTRHL